MSSGINAGINNGIFTGTKRGGGLLRFLLPPTALTFVSKTSTTITYSFTPSQQGAATGYQIRNLSTVYGTASFGATLITATGLDPSTPYTLYCVTTDGTNISSESNSVTETTRDPSTGGLILSSFEAPLSSYGNQVGTIPPPIGSTGSKTGSVFGPGETWTASQGYSDGVLPYRGSAMCETYLPFGDSAYGYNYTVPGVSEGSHLWIRFFQNFPPTWLFSPLHGPKGFRWVMNGPSGQFLHNIYFGDGSFYNSINGANATLWNTNMSGLKQFTPGCRMSTGNPVTDWQSIEAYMFFTSVPGQGIFRVWLNDVLKLDDSPAVGKGTNTLKNSGDYLDKFRYLEWYSDYGSVQNQTCYSDCVAITDSIDNTIEDPNNSGYRFIGKDQFLT